MNEYRLTRAADADLLELFIYGFETFGLVQAEDYRNDMTRCFELLAANPKLGREADELAPGARRHEHARHVIFYDEQPYGVLVTAVLHERRIHRLLRP